MAGTTDVKSLLLEVDASVELLRRNLTRGDQAVGQFESETRSRLERIDRRFEQLGGGLRQLPGTIARARSEIASIGTSAARTEQQVRNATAGMRAALLSSTSVIAAAFSVDKIKDYADGYTRYTNQLKIAGLEGASLADVQQRLYTIAQANGAPLEAIGTLYGRAAQSGRALGASQADLIKFTGAVGAALKIQGGSAEQAQGALLQLSQALGSGTVHAEEFNSVNEGLRPILQAAADASEKYRGNVALLKADVNAQKLSSQDFFRLILAGYDALQTKASKASLTIGASLTILNNALGKYIGETDQTLSATERVSQGIVGLANNLNIVAPALLLVGARFAVARIAGSEFARGIVTDTAAAIATTRVMAQELAQENVVLIGGKIAVAQKAQAVKAAAIAEVAGIEATIAARRADQAAIAETLALIERQRAESVLAVRQQAFNSQLNFGLGRAVTSPDAARANADLKAQIVAKRALAGVDAELAAAETALTAAQARARVASRAAKVAADEATFAARAGAAASKLFAGGLTLIGGSVAGGAAILVIGALIAAYISYSNAAQAAEDRNKATAQALRETSDAGKTLNRDLAALVTMSGSAASGVAQVGASAAASTGKMLSFAGAVGEAAEKLRQLALARRDEQVTAFTTASVAAEHRANEAQARIDARNRPNVAAAQGGSAMAVSGGTVLTNADKRANADDARIVAANRGQQQAAYQAAQRAANIPLANRIRESDRVGGRDVEGDLARVTRDLTVARERGLRSQVDALEAQRFELTQYKKYRKAGLSAQAASDAASKDASSFRSASAGAQGDRDAKASARAKSKADREAAAADRRQKAEVRDAAADERAYSAAERQANNDIAAARADLTNSAVERAKIEKDRIEAERVNRNNEIAQQAKQGGLGEGKVAETRKLELQRLNDQRAALETQVVDALERQRVADEALAVASADRSNQVELLQKQSDLVTSASQRRDLERRILAVQYDEERAKLEGVIASRDTTEAEKKIARKRLELLGQLQAADQEGIDRKNAGAVDQYRQRLRNAVGDMHDALDTVAADGLQSVEDGLTGIISGTESVGSAFKRMAQSIIADLARIAIEKAILGAIGGGFLGFAGGGSLADAPGRADGGSLGGLIRGPGTGRSDSILALLSGPGGGAVRLSNREFIMNEQAVNFYGPDAMADINARRVPRFADGGSLNGLSRPPLRAPAAPKLSGLGQQGQRLQVTGKIEVASNENFDAKMTGLAFQAVGASAEPIMAGAETRTIRRLRRPDLPGGFD